MPILGSRAGGSAAGFGFSGIKKGLIEATGGDISDCGDYKVHVFTSPGSLSVSYVSPCSPGAVDYLVVAGGGGSTSNTIPGGAGAGGFRESKQPSAPWTASPLASATGVTVAASPGSYPVAVGGGGALANCCASPANQGGTSTFGPINSTGGGGAGWGNTPSTTPPTHGQPGGSGSSAGQGNFAARPGGSGNAGGYSPPEGNPGPAARTSANDPVTGGGGGATASGTLPTSPTGTNGGAGAGTQIAPPSYGEVCGSLRYFSGGGGGSGLAGRGNGGIGGGGDGWAYGQPDGTPLQRNGLANTGGGAGKSSNGGSGVVIIRYKYQ